MPKVDFELCCADIYSVELASYYNFQGVELCVDLKSGGLSPTIGFVKTARSLFKNEIAVLIRPNKGNFVYSELEKQIILHDIETLSILDIDTFVIGAVYENVIDVDFITACANKSRGKKLCFHRAFDNLPDKYKAIETLIKLNVQRILTSGGIKPIAENINVLKDLVINYSSSIEIMTGGGITEQNIPSILTTGVRRIHFSATQKSNISKQSDLDQFGQREIADKNIIESIMHSVQTYFKQD